jgi:plasmid stability protein
MLAKEKKMANLTIRNLDDDVVAKLKAQAKAHHRSLEAELREILSATVGPRAREDFLARADRIAAMTPKTYQTDSTLLIREDRDTDHGRDR